MDFLKRCLKNILPTPIIALLSGATRPFARLKRIVVYAQYDSSAYWRSRARGTGQSRVLWVNEEYNKLYRERQREILQPYLQMLHEGDRVLDIGCGIGIVAVMIAAIRPDIRIDAVDFPEMIEVAEKENQAENIFYISSTAETYHEANKTYKLIVSSACFSAIRDIKSMETAMNNCLNMLAPEGYVLLIDPFHRWNYLARAKYSSRQVIRFMKERGMELIYKSGVLFWPYRDWVCNSSMKGEDLRIRFSQGERFLHLLGPHLWADYKVLAFRRKRC